MMQVPLIKNWRNLPPIPTPSCEVLSLDNFTDPLQLTFKCTLKTVFSLIKTSIECRRPRVEMYTGCQTNGCALQRKIYWNREGTKTSLPDNSRHMILYLGVRGCSCDLGPQGAGLGSNRAVNSRDY